MHALIGTNADWYLMRASGFVVFVLCTLTACLGVANLARVGRRPSTRTVATLVHRNASLLALAFLAVHVVTAISDKYVTVSALSIVVPGLSGYDPFWVGLGALSLDLMLAVVVTSLLRARLRYRSWQLVHWLAYLSWPSALLHSIGSGSGTGADTGTVWSSVIYGVCAAAFAAAVYARLTLHEPAVTPAPALRRPVRYAPPAAGASRSPRGADGAGRPPAARAGRAHQPQPAAPPGRSAPGRTPARAATAARSPR